VLKLADRPIDYNTTLGVGSFRRRPVPPVVRDWLNQYLFRNLGSLCLHLVWVAAGFLDAAYAVECKLWDIAAGSLLIQEAGGLATNHIGHPLWPKDLQSYRGEDIPILAGSPRMHGRLLDAMSRSDDGGGK
jgi:fructose-1,6-bisphosphatase/inositol monophosphatase family enzyme